MKMFLRILSAERLKLSGSHIWLLVLASPAAAVLIGLFAATPAGGKPDWTILLTVMSMLHAALFLPILSGLYAAMLCRHEHLDGGWKALLALPVSRTAVYLAKFAVAALLLAATQAVFMAAVIGTGLFRGIGTPIPWELLLRSISTSWVACLPLAALQMAVSQAWSSFAAPLALNVSFTLPNILIANSATYGPYYPWVQPLLAMIPHGQADYGAFNLPLESLLIVVLGSFVVFLAAGLLSFRRKAV
ncbi:ABC transporter permease [Paenibacillus durus]|uniref:Membrane protein n=2 Tax=Paenibacillus durus TaxID=44251 RepID=A0A0F7FE64_PAEDU|nr:ABC transporter permease [Paenibacillus durus]AKG37164.1 membrane protein [Paenibacillus durus ATCC 35681]